MMKKASLNLSIQAIVIVVIAFVVLGLGLSFVKSTFKDIGGTSKEVQAKIKEQILEDMRTSGKKLSVSQEIRLERGDETTENVGIVNTGISTKKFGINIEIVKKQNPDGSTVPAAEIGQEISFFYSDAIDKVLSPTSGDVIPVTISAKSGASGNYLCKVTVHAADEMATGCNMAGDAGCESYDIRTFFVKVS